MMPSLDPTLVSSAAARLTSLAHALEIEDGSFDDMVYDAAGDASLADLNEEAGHEGQEEIISSSERDASAINNSGFEGQFAFLLEGYPSVEAGEVDLEQRIRAFAAG